MRKGDFFMDNRDEIFHLYDDIQMRTNGEIYCGVTGPVRSGKSTFIKGYMENCVIPYMDDPNEKNRLIDEMPQSAQGVTIMTTEPKFVPQNAAILSLSEDTKVKLRFIDCVGFLIPGSSGYKEGEKDRMVQTPWCEEDISFSQAASIGTEKVIKEHSTIGIVMTTDGSIGDIDGANYREATLKCILEWKETKKPFLVIYNTTKPYSDEARKYANEMENEYKVRVFPMNVKQANKDDYIKLLEKMLYEFPVIQINYMIPKWTELLSNDHEVKQRLLSFANTIMDEADTMSYFVDSKFELLDGMKSICMTERNLAKGSVTFRIMMEESYYYAYISEMTGVEISGEGQMIQLIKSLSEQKKEYEKVKSAIESVDKKGYGVVMPELSDITMDNPVLISHGNKYGVKMKAISPSIHMIKANIETEIAPIVGNKEQAEDLITYLKQGEESKEGIWTTNIFGKSIGELMEDGIKSKIMQMDDGCQMKLQDTMQKVVNDGNGGMICIII